MKIHRYLLNSTVQIPAGAVFLNAQPGQQGISGWFLCDPTAPMEDRSFAVVATGQELPDAIMDCPHIQTIKAIVMCNNEPTATALHVFETTNASGKIPSLKLGANQPSKDPADWWKE
jgi:hypothetical protein